MIEREKLNWNKNRGGPGKHGLQGRGIQEMNAKAHQEANASLIEKTTFKTKLQELFKNGKTPDNLTDEDLAQILNIQNTLDKEARRRLIFREVRNMFGTAVTKSEVIKFQYQLYQESKNQT